jgi:hypothetical protein
MNGQHSVKRNYYSVASYIHSHMYHYWEWLLWRLKTLEITSLKWSILKLNRWQPSRFLGSPANISEQRLQRALKMVALCYSEMVIPVWETDCHVLEDCNHNINHCENLRSHILDNYLTSLVWCVLLNPELHHCIHKDPPWAISIQSILLCFDSLRLIMILSHLSWCSD